MMVNRDINELSHIQYLIGKIQKKEVYDTTTVMNSCQELLTLSKEHNYLYGQAIAHIYLAENYQIMHDRQKYDDHMKSGSAIAKRKDYFDVLITAYNLQGLHYGMQGDDITALSMYLNGVKLAVSINDKKASSVIYNNIAEIFFNAQEYAEAENFYHESLITLHDVTHSNVNLYRKITLANMIRTLYLEDKFDDIQQYYEAFSKIQYHDEVIALIELEIEARMALIKADKEKAKQLLTQLVDKVKASQLEASLIDTIYIYTLSLLMDLQMFSLVRWCIEKMEKLYGDTNKYINLLVLRHKIYLSDSDTGDDDQFYESFFNQTMAFDNADKIAMGESLKSIISLYIAEKVQSKMLAEQSRLENESERDELTQVYNRRHLSKLISKGIQDQDAKSIGYIMIDVDHFKGYNDYYGHAQGDYVLQQVADTLQAHAQKNTYVARYGGDEFACLLMGASKEEIIQYIESVRADLITKQIEHVKNMSVKYVSLSFGIYYDNAHKIVDEYDVIRKADEALYSAKKKGRNTYAFYVDESAI